MSCKLLLVGEAWGDREQRYKHALVGASGVELAKMLSEANLAPKPHNKYPSEMDMIYYWGMLENKYGIKTANVFNIHPPNNDLLHFFSADGDRSIPSIRVGGRVGYICNEFRGEVEKLWQLIQTERPNLVVCMGNTACWAVLGQTKISEIRGTIQQSQRLGCKTLPIYHPAAILRDWSLRPITLSDLQKALRESAFPEVRRIERWITCHDHVNNIRITLDEIRDWLKEPAHHYAVDIETGYALFNKSEIKSMTSRMKQTISSQISMVGFASSPNRALVIPFMDRNMPGLNYWPTLDEEVAAWRLMIQGLKTPIPKIFQNGMFDISHFVSNGIIPQNCADDTMLRHHALYPELLKSLGFLGSVYSNEISWKQMYGKHESYKRDE